MHTTCNYAQRLVLEKGSLPSKKFMDFNHCELLGPGPDLRGADPRHPTNRGPPTKQFIFYFSIMIDAYETTT